MPDSYPSDWDTRRKKIYSRDDYTCQNCGIKGKNHGSTELHAHHIVPVSKGGSHDTNNLVTICDQCHKSIHNESKMARTEANRREKASPENYEGLKKGAIKIRNIIAEIEDIHKRADSQLKKLHDYMEKMLKYVDEPGMEAPEKLSSAYIKTYRSYDSNCSEIRSHLVEIKETISQFDFSSETEQAFSVFLEKTSAEVATWESILEEYDSIASIEDENVILSVVSSDSIEWDVNVQIAYDNLRDANKEWVKAGNKSGKALTNDLQNN